MVMFAAAVAADSTAAAADVGEVHKQAEEQEGFKD